MIEIEKARHAVGVARQYADEGRFDACVAVLEKLLTVFPPSYRFGPHIAQALGAPEWGIDWSGVETEIVSAVNAQIVDELRRRNKLAADNRAKARRPRASKFEWMKVIAKEVAEAKPSLSDSHLAVLVLDKAQTRTENDTELPSERTVRGWIRKIRAT